MQNQSDTATPESDSSSIAQGDEATSSLFETLTDSYDKLMQGELTDASSALLTKLVLPAVAALVMLIVAYFIAKLISRWTSSAICRRVDQTLGKFAGKLVFYTAMLISGIAVLQTMGVGVTSFAAVLAAAGFAIGLAFQGTLSNFAAGILLLVFRPFQVGDFVNTAGIAGKVNAIDLFTTTFDTPDNRRLIVPNSSITGATIENVSFHAERRVDVVVGVEYQARLDKTRDVLTRCAESFSDVTISGKGRGFQVILSNLGANSVDWTIRIWTRKEDFFAVKEALTEEIKLQLDEEGIGIPFPQMQLHLDQAQVPVLASTGKSDAIHLEPETSDSNENAAPQTKFGPHPIRPRTRGERP